MLIAGFIYRLADTLSTNGGGDLLNADMVKLHMLFLGQNPYLGSTWQSPYPPLYLLLLAGIVLLPSIPAHAVSFSLAVITLRLALVTGHVMLAGLAYLFLKRSNQTETMTLVIPGLILFLPSFTQVGEVFFHGDIFGILLLAVSLLSYQSNKNTTGNLLLALSASFKLQTIYCLPLITLYQYKQEQANTRNMLTLYLPFLLLTIVPLSLVPGYYDTVIGFNLNNNNYWGYSSLNLLRHLPTSLTGFQVTNTTINQVWIPLAILSLGLALLYTDKHSTNLQPASLIVLGVAAWLLPLRELQLHYLLWLVVPLLFMGLSRWTILVLGLYEFLADFVAYLYTVNGAWNTLSKNLYFSDALILCQIVAAIIVGVTVVTVARTTRGSRVTVPQTVQYGTVKRVS